MFSSRNPINHLYFSTANLILVISAKSSETVMITTAYGLLPMLKELSIQDTLKVGSTFK